MEKYDFLIVGAGLFGCVCADILTKNGKTVLVVEKMNHIGGTCYTRNEEGIHVHQYGAHIFRTNSDEIFNYFSSFSKLNNFINSPVAIHNGRAYNLPFNMNTFSQIWGIYKPEDAKKHITDEINESGIANPKNLREQAIKLAGTTIFEWFIKDYTEKQWGKKCEDLPPDIIRRIPLRYTFNNNYYNASYQGIPIGGYTKIFEKMLEKCDVRLNIDFNSNRNELSKLAKTIIYTGPIDAFYDYRFGELEYRGLKFVEKRFESDNYQGNAVLNYSDHDVPYTRSIEHKHFDFVDVPFTIVSYEYPIKWEKGMYPFYPINDNKNNLLYSKYCELAYKEKNVVFGGRLGKYQYYDMQDTIKAAFELCKELI